jgi:hypothetical protein
MKPALLISVLEEYALSSFTTYFNHENRGSGRLFFRKRLLDGSLSNDAFSVTRLYSIDGRISE